MPTPTTPFEKEFLDRCQAAGIETDINVRWEKGMDHHPKSQATMKMIAASDWLFGNDSFCWKVGGDGDNGETLMFLMDIGYELEDAERPKVEEDGKPCPTCSHVPDTRRKAQVRHLHVKSENLKAWLTKIGALVGLRESAPSKVYMAIQAKVFPPQ